MRVQIGAGVVAAFMVLANFGAAQDAGLRRLDTADQERGWEAVGRVNLGNFAFCTGTLIAADVVLTAAHCLYDARTGRRVAARQIVFMAGLRDGRAAAYRGARRVYVDPGYTYDDQRRVHRVAADLALIELDQPIRQASIRPFSMAKAVVGRGTAVEMVSYALTRDKAPSLQKVCHVIGTERGMAVLTCLADFGASGAPILVRENGQTRIASVVSAKAVWNARPVALAAMTLGARVSKLMAGLRAADRVFRRPRQRDRVMTLDVAMRATGAKFIRP